MKQKGTQTNQRSFRRGLKCGGLFAAGLLFLGGCSDSGQDGLSSAPGDEGETESGIGGGSADDSENADGGANSTDGGAPGTEASTGGTATEEGVGGSSENVGTGGSSQVGTGGAPSGPTPNCEGADELPQCVADMADNGGGTVVLAAQTYLLKDTLILENDVSIVGQGDASLITWDDSVKDSIDKPLLFSSSVDDIELQDFTVHCSIDQDPNSSDLRNEQIGIYLYCGGDPSIGEATGCNNVNLERIEVAYCAHGVHLKGVTGVNATDLNLHHNGNTEVDFFHNVYFRRVANLVVKQTTPTSGGFYESPRGHGIRGSHLKNVYFEGLSVYDNADHGIHVDIVYDMRLHNMDVHDNCANSSGACAAIKCYGEVCELDTDAAQEP